MMVGLMIFTIIFAHIILNTIIFILDRGALITIIMLHNHNQDSNNPEYIIFHLILNNNHNLNHNKTNQDKRPYADLLQNAMIKFHLTPFNQTFKDLKISFKQLFYADKIYTG
jgi:hypothetical protein